MTFQSADARALWALQHTGDIDEDPDSDGSDYVSIPCEEIGEIEDGLAQLETSQQDGTEHGASAPEVGPDGWKLTIKTLLRGLGTSGGAGTSPGSMSYMEMFLANLLADSTSEVGRALDSGSSTSSIVLTSSVGGLQSLFPIYEAGKPDSAKRQRTQWAMVTDAGSAPTYAIAPTIDEAPTSSAIKRPAKIFRAPYAGDGESNGALMAFVHKVGGVATTLLGGRLTGCKWTIQAGKLAMAEWTFQGDSQVVEDKASLPAYTRTTVPGIVGVKSPVWFNGSSIGTADVEIDWSPTMNEDLSTAGVNGRSDLVIAKLAPKITLSPTYSNTIRALKRAITKGPMLIQIGAGVHDGTRLNTIAVHFGEAFASKADGKNDSGRHRAGLAISVSRAGLISGSTRAEFAQVALA